MRVLFLFWFIASASYIAMRGKVRFSFWRQLSDDSMFLAPINSVFYIFSTLKRGAYIDPSAFPELASLRANWQTIRDEALVLDAAQSIAVAEDYSDIGFNSFVKSGWRRFYLKSYDDPRPSTQALCPVTTRLLQEIPTVRAAMFAQLPPGASLVRHRAPYAGSVRYHLGLATVSSPDCYIEVDGEQYYWRDGEEVMFDETYIHYVKNETEVSHIVLFCEIERPMRYRWTVALNRILSNVLLRAATSQNDTGDHTGFSNRAFKYIYAIRRLGKRIKAWHRPTYYAVKWVMFGSILAGIIYAL